MITVTMEDNKQYVLATVGDAEAVQNSLGQFYIREACEWHEMSDRYSSEALA